MRGPEWTPAQLAEMKGHVASGKSAREIAELFGRTRKAIIQTVYRNNLGPWPRQDMSLIAHIPDDFAERWKTTSLLDLSCHYNRGLSTVALWAKRCGLVRPRGSHITKARPAPPKAKAPLRLVKPNAYATSPVDRPRRDASRAGMAADFLRKFGAVYRCNERGGADVAGTMWRRGSAVLSDNDLIERAERQGWDADAWKRVA